MSLKTLKLRFKSSSWQYSIYKLYLILERTGAVQPGKKKDPGRPHLPFQNLKEVCKKDEDRLFSRAWSNRTGGYGFKLRQRRFSLDIRKTLPPVRVIKHWNSFPCFPFSQKGRGNSLVQAGQGSESPAQCRDWTRWPLRVITRLLPEAVNYKEK